LRETKLFERQDDQISISKTYKADGIQQKTRNNALFLSVCAQFNVKISEEILGWLSNNLNIISGLNDSDFLRYTIKCLRENQNRDEIIQLIKKLDLGINEIEVDRIEVTPASLPDEIPDDIKKLILKNRRSKINSINTVHRKFDREGNDISIELFDLERQESEGTQKIFAIAGLIIDTLKNSKVLIIDEFDARLHPLISRAIVELFNFNETNPNHAQMIFMTHDTNMLSNKLFRRDQIWFTEKNRYGATDLYSLAEYKVRNDASYESDYIKGKYGAIPYIGNLNNLVDSHA
jgi:uncharacterized protein